MSTRESNLKEKFRIALTSTAKVISDDFDLNKKKSENNKSKDISSIEIDNINSPSDFIRLRAETDSSALKKKFSNDDIYVTIQFDSFGEQIQPGASLEIPRNSTIEALNFGLTYNSSNSPGNFWLDMNEDGVPEYGYNGTGYGQLGNQTKFSDDSFILNDNPLSILKTEGAGDVAIELNSLSKTFNMAGWRVGMVVGKDEIIKSILQVKSNMDSGMFLGIQKGAVEALNSSKDWFQNPQQS